MLSECILLVRLGYGQTAASASVVGMVDRFPMMLSFEAASWRPMGLGDHAGFLSGRLTSSNVGTCVLPNQDSNVAPQTSQDAWPVCGTRNFVSVRLYSAPQSHWTIVAILGISAFGELVQAGLLAAIKSDHSRTRLFSADKGLRSEFGAKRTRPAGLAMSVDW
jgi:hypothetical protein